MYLCVHYMMTSL